MSAEIYVVPSEGLSLRQILWRRYHLPTPGLIEAVLEANRYLVLDAEELPVGTKIVLPAREAVKTTDKPLTLWE